MSAVSIPTPITRANGATQALLSAHRFDASMIAALVNHGLAMIMYERVRDSGEMVEVTKVRITEKGRAALGES
jgi:hypothetical protein